MDQLEKIIRSIREDAYEDGEHGAGHPHSIDNDKRAIKKLIKELVEEAKPAEKDQLAQSTLYDESRCRFYRYGGYNSALYQFEQNLLKALEG